MKKYKVKINNKLKAYGESDDKEGVITINKDIHKKKKGMYGIPKKDATLINTLVHEKRHLDHPKETEKAVRKNTRTDLSKMSAKQKGQLYKLLNRNYS